VSKCPNCGVDWLTEHHAHMGVDIIRLADGSREAQLLACCVATQQQVLMRGYAAVYGQQLTKTLAELGLSPEQVRTWEPPDGMS
jgi:hypothetical protein